jgi:hypothetical protein
LPKAIGIAPGATSGICEAITIREPASVKPG